LTEYVDQKIQEQAYYNNPDNPKPKLAKFQQSFGNFKEEYFKKYYGGGGGGGSSSSGGGGGGGGGSIQSEGQGLDEIYAPVVGAEPTSNPLGGRKPPPGGGGTGGAGGGPSSTAKHGKATGSSSKVPISSAFQSSQPKSSLPQTEEEWRISKEKTDENARRREENIKADQKLKEEEKQPKIIAMNQLGKYKKAVDSLVYGTHLDANMLKEVNNILKLFGKPPTKITQKQTIKDMLHKLNVNDFNEASATKLQKVVRGNQVRKLAKETETETKTKNAKLLAEKMLNELIDEAGNNLDGRRKYVGNLINEASYLAQQERDTKKREAQASSKIRKVARSHLQNKQVDKVLNDLEVEERANTAVPPQPISRKEGDTSNDLENVIQWEEHIRITSVGNELKEKIDDEDWAEIAPVIKRMLGKTYKSIPQQSTIISNLKSIVDSKTTPEEVKKKVSKLKKITPKNPTTWK
jgi:hypothetical protein